VISERGEDDLPLPAAARPEPRGIIDRMGTQASNQTRVAIDAFADADP
jgi:phosphate uptake regulator